ncbi:hypothetical protein CDG79_23090 [Nostoc sp. 'Peltigera membranacea cyanobiont' 232]|nr:hypothetical protein CDG79_23090 [Nostoc sp. 'Peltigera membranacea cyanobiont' 232]
MFIISTSIQNVIYFQSLLACEPLSEYFSANWGVTPINLAKSSDSNGNYLLSALMAKNKKQLSVNGYQLSVF